MNIIGQEKLIANVNRLVTTNNFPRYSIIQGPYGAGKKLMAFYISQKLDATFVPCELGIDAVREVIELSYKQTSPIVYMWADSQKMSLGAKNAILKITEEPPQNSYFIMTVDNINNLLPTLLSRGTLFNLDPYTPKDLQTFSLLKIPDISETDRNVIVNISNTPQDILDLSTLDISQFNKIVNVFCDNVGKINLANSLKVSTFLKYKEEEVEKFDPILFLRACMFRCFDLFLQTKDAIYSNMITITSRYLSDLFSKSLSKNSTVDNWIIDMHLASEQEV